MEPRPPRSRYRSSTSASTPPIQEAPASTLALILQRISRYTDFTLGTLQKIKNDVAQLTGHIDILVTPNTTQDEFRRSRGFQVLLKLLQSAVVAESSLIGPRESVWTQICSEVLKVFSEALKEHHGNRRYFAKRAKGWAALQEIFHQYVLRVSSSSLADDSIYRIAGLIKVLVAFATGVAVLQCPPVSTPSRSSTAEEKVQSPDTNGSAHAANVGDEEGSVSQVRVNQSDDSQIGQVRAYVQHSPNNTERICNEGAVGVLATLYTDLTAQGLALPDGMPLSLIILAFIERLVNISNHNRTAVHGSGVLSSLLPCLIQRKGDTQETVLLRTLCDSLLGLGTHQLSEAVELFRQASESDEARDMLLKALRQSKQPSSIQFDLSNDGHCSIELPALPRAFPPTSGYSFTAWIQVDQFDADSHTTLFGAFDATQTCFVLLYIEKNTRQLILQTSVTSAKPSVRFKKARFQARTWYHVALVHRPPKAGNLGQATLYINGRFVEELHSQYPDASPSLPESREGITSPQTTASRRRPVQAFFGTPRDLASQPVGRTSESRWSLANAHLYDTCLSLDMVAVQDSIGPRYCGNFQDCIGAFLTYRASAELNRYNETIYREKSDKSEIVRLTQQHGNEILSESKLLISISASAIADINGTLGKSSNLMSMLNDKAIHQYNSLTRNGNPILINAARPAINEAILRPHGVATVTGNPVILLAQSLDDASWQIGGCLPISMKILQNATTDEGITTAVKILFECIQDNWRTSEAMEKGDGFGVLAVVLREKLGLANTTSFLGLLRNSVPSRSSQQRDDLALRLLKISLKFVGYDFEHPERSLLINPMAYRVLLVDFDTWRTVSLECQKLYFRQISDFIWKNNNQSFNMKRFNRNRKQLRQLGNLFY